MFVRISQADQEGRRIRDDRQDSRQPDSNRSSGLLFQADLPSAKHVASQQILRTSPRPTVRNLPGSICQVCRRSVPISAVKGPWCEFVRKSLKPWRKYFPAKCRLILRSAHNGFVGIWHNSSRVSLPASRSVLPRALAHLFLRSRCSLVRSSPASPPPPYSQKPSL